MVLVTGRQVHDIVRLLVRLVYTQYITLVP